MTSRDSVPRWLKVSVACAALAVLAIGVDWGELPGHLAQLDWRLAALALLVVVLELPVNAAKWWWSLRLHDLNFRWWYLLRTGCIAYFLNNFLPSAIGGDVYRIYKTMSGGEKAGAVSAVLVERI